MSGLGRLLRGVPNADLPMGRIGHPVTSNLDRPVIAPVPSSSTSDPAADRASEQALVGRCVSGDAQAWRSLYDEHFPMVERLVRSVGVTDGDLDDLCQEIFLIVYRHLGRFRGDARLGTWIYKLAVREAIRFAKRRRLRRSLGELFARERGERPPSDWTESEAARRHLLRQLLARLAPERRMALVLYEIEGLSVTQIAQLASCRENTVWTRLHRARGDLGRMLEDTKGSA